MATIWRYPSRATALRALGKKAFLRATLEAFRRAGTGPKEVDLTPASGPRGRSESEPKSLGVFLFGRKPGYRLVTCMTSDRAREDRRRSRRRPVWKFHPRSS
jgi:hypothetical protein